MVRIVDRTSGFCKIYTMTHQSNPLKRKSKETHKLFDVDIPDQPQLEVLVYVLAHGCTPGKICCLKSCTAIIGTWPRV